jgi:hydroxymethylpyrimidine pyrophosphatase-like HAD family hydrolase
MQRYIFLDLDDTLFQTRPKCDAESGLNTLLACAFLEDGTPNSFATVKQQWLWQWLDEGFKCIPVTGRDLSAFERVNLTFTEEVVLNHGAVILKPDRTIDRRWSAALLAQLPLYQNKLLNVWQAVQLYTKQHSGFSVRLVNDFDTLWYGVIKHAAKTEAALRPLLETIIRPQPSVVDGSLYWHLNGNNLAVLPKIINKESAVAYLIARYRERYAQVLTFGAGDSHSDAAFMTLCDYALIPKNTQLFNVLTSRA